MKFLTLGLVLVLGVACATKKPANPSHSSEHATTEEFVLNGSSDSHTAGGLKTIYFDYQSDDLDSGAKADLDDNSELLKNNVKVYIQVEGHCDERGGSQFNLALGERRAKAVKNYLRLKGIPVKRIQTISYGKEKPVEHTSNENSWSKNRRANFIIISK